MSRKKLLIPLNLTLDPPVIDTTQVQGKVTQEEFEIFWRSLKAQVKSVENQHRIFKILNAIISILLCIALFLSAFRVLGRPIIIASAILVHLAIFYVFLNLSTKRKTTKRTQFLERENKKNWKPRGLRWSIERTDPDSLEETLVLSEDNEIVLNLHLGDTGIS